MECKEFERLIPRLLKDDLDYNTLVQVHSHMGNCKACKEEFVIQFLVTEGMQRLEEGDAFDLQNELQIKMDLAKKRLRFHDRLTRIGVALEIVAFCMMAGIVAWLML